MEVNEEKARKQGGEGSFERRGKKERRKKRRRECMKGKEKEEHKDKRMEEKRSIINHSCFTLHYIVYLVNFNMSTPFTTSVPQNTYPLCIEHCQCVLACSNTALQSLTFRTAGKCLS